MQDLKTPYLRLPLPAQGNKLRQDRPRIADSFTALDDSAKTQDGRLDEVETRAGNLEQRATDVEGRADALEDRTTATEQAQAATEQELAAAVEAQRAALAAHDALVRRITVGNLSPIIGICCVEDGGGSGLWCNIDAEGQPLSPTRRYFDYHPTYNAIRRVLVDGQIMQEHSKFYCKAFTIASGPFAGRRGRLISPGQQPHASFKKVHLEIGSKAVADHRYIEIIHESGKKFYVFFFAELRFIHDNAVIFI